MEQNLVNLDSLPVLYGDPNAIYPRVSDVAYTFLQYEDTSSSPLQDDELYFDNPFDTNTFMNEFNPSDPISSEDSNDSTYSPNTNPSSPIRPVITPVPLSGQLHFTPVPDLSFPSNVPAPQPPVPSVPGKSGYSIRILGVPAKSRVETQLKLCLQLINNKGKNVTSYNQLVLPPNLLVTGKRLRKKEEDRKLNMGEPHLIFESGVICNSDPNKTILRCFGCIQRERKLMQRKSAASAKSKVKMEEEEETNTSVEEEQQKILQLYSPSVVDFSYGEAIIPSRITCYCRHHDEKTGFQIWIRLKDGKTGQEIASGLSTPVMITDDHKSKGKGPSPVTVGGTPAIPSTTQTTTTGRTNKRSKPEESSSSPIEASQPLVEKVIPSEGPITGGIEVTILGDEFSNTDRCLFGDNEALSTSYWGPKTLLCILPPAVIPMTVPITIKGINNPNQKPVLFTYKDESDRLMLELALQIVGMKLTGKIDDARQIAMRIVQSNQDSFQRAIKGDTAPGMGRYHYNHKSIEDALLLSLQGIAKLNNDFPLNFNLKNKAGQTLLMLAVVNGNHELVKFLLKNGANVNEQDCGGNTALMFACLLGYAGIAQILLTEPTPLPEMNTVNKQGQSASQIALSRGYDFILGKVTEEPVKVVTPREGRTTAKLRSSSHNSNNDEVIEVKNDPDDEIRVIDEDVEALLGNGKGKPNSEAMFNFMQKMKHLAIQYRALFGVAFFIAIGIILFRGGINVFSSKSQVETTPSSKLVNDDSSSEESENKNKENNGNEDGHQKQLRPPSGTTGSLNFGFVGSGNSPEPEDNQINNDVTAFSSVNKDETPWELIVLVVYAVIALALVCMTLYGLRHRCKVRNVILTLGITIVLLIVLFLVVASIY